MKCAKMRVVLEMTVPYDGWDDENIEFDVNENRCIGTGMVGLFLDQIHDWGEDTSSCWGCAIQKDMELLEIVELSTEEIEASHPWLVPDAPGLVDAEPMAVEETETTPGTVEGEKP
jgi:hypothetical protein